MSIKHRFLIGVLTGMLGFGSVWSNGPASTDYVDKAITSLQNELNNAVAQVNANINGLSATDSQLFSLMSEFKVRLEILNNSTKEAGKSFDGKIELVQNQISELPIITHKIGDIFQGGMVFYVDASRQHGLIAALTDASDNTMEWRNGQSGDRRVNAQSQGLGAGEFNTHLIVAEQTADEQEGLFAALAAANFQVTADGVPCSATLSVGSPCIGGWYLPSAFELMLLYTNLKQSGPGDFGNDAYWSSSETSATDAWLVDFGSGQSVIKDKSTLAHVRAIHAF